MKQILLTLTASLSIGAHAQTTSEAQWNTPGAGNPVVPGYFADPTIRKFGDTYYIYATTDGTGASSQPPQVWASKDFVNWQNYILNWPVTNLAWAPDVVQQPDGTFRYYYCTSECVIREGESTSPVGPFANRLGETNAPLIGNYFVPGAITLDPHLFRDDDGQEYLYFGTWGIYKDHGCGVARLSADGKTLSDQTLIPNTEIKDFFEAPWVFKRQGIYYFLYSSGLCEDETYAVQYAVSKSPMGPYEWKGKIVETNADGTVHGPGHNSVLVEGDNYYIVYHRHNNPVHSTGGYNRQVAIDRLQFDSDGNILPVKPTHQGVIPKEAQQLAQKYEGKNLAFKAKVNATSTYDSHFLPEYITDDNNGTLWRAARNDTVAGVTIDLGRQQRFDQIFTQFEYATFYYQYTIEVSADGKEWTMHADRRQNRTPGSPMVDCMQTEARYVRITIYDTQHRGHFPAIWNVRVYQSTADFNPATQLPRLTYDQQAAIAAHRGLERMDVTPQQRMEMAKSGHRVLRLNAGDHKPGTSLMGIPVVAKKGKLAFRFNGQQRMEIKDAHNETLVYNSPYTIAAWILNPEVADKETIVQLSDNTDDRGTVELRNGSNRAEGLVGHYNGFHNSGAPDAIAPGEWQHWVVSYDGYMERVYCNGTEVSTRDTYLNLRPSNVISIGGCSEGDNPFSGFIHSVDIWDRAFNETEVSALMAQPSDMTPEQEEEASQLNLTTGLAPRIDAKILSPQLAQLNITDQQGGELPEGLFEYAVWKDGTTDTLWTDRSELLIGLTESRHKHSFRVMVQDVAGNRTKPQKTNFTVRQADFTRLLDTLPDHVTLISQNATLGEEPSKELPMRTAGLTGDFVLQCRIEDMTGLQQHNTPAYNEAGILLMSDGNGRQDIIHLGAFPNYNCGNMLTIVHHGRPQYNNSMGYDFHRYMQLERRGTLVYARTSPDGVTWTDMPHSPVDASFLPEKVTAGIYQCTYSANQAGATFSDVRLWVRE